MMLENIKKHLHNVYGASIDKDYYTLFEKVLEDHKTDLPSLPLWDESDIFLITYGDNITKRDEAPLQTLNSFLKKYLKEVFSTVHILPYFPYTSDDGFAVKSFRSVNPDLGTWTDIKNISREFKLMTDLVINHASSQNLWFNQYLRNEEPGKGFFFDPPTDFDVSNVVRPRNSPLISNYQTKNGVKKAWTTFSKDQIDLNYHNPYLLLEMIKVLLWYIKNGSRVIRLDAIAFIWKESATSCMHLPQTHHIVKLLRAVIEYCAPGVVMITETNVPHIENISYFGDGDEAHMVYQFPLPPLILYTLNKGNAIALTRWAESLKDPGKDKTWFNFTASHDGIGVRPLEGLIPNSEKRTLIDNMINFGALITNRRLPNGTEQAYEINITYFDALKGVGNKPDAFQYERFISSQAMMIALKGIPAVYIQSLFGAPNNSKEAKELVKNRAINRKKYSLSEAKALVNGKSDKSPLYNQLIHLLKIRKQQAAFHPDAEQRILDIGHSFFAFLRINPISKHAILCVTNVTNQEKSIVSVNDIRAMKHDLITETTLSTQQITLHPYQTMWLTQKYV